MPLTRDFLCEPSASDLLRRAAHAGRRWAAIGGLIAVTGVGFALWRQPAPLRTGDPDAALAVVSTPTGAIVEVDGHLHGHTPARVPLPAGEHRLTLRRASYADAVYTVQVAPGQTAALAAELWLQTPIVQRLCPTFPGSTITDARFLADGRLAYIVTLPGDERQLWLLDERGGARRLGPAEGHGSVVAAPDGARVAYLAHGGGADFADGRLDELWLAASDDEGGDRRYVLPSAAERLVDLSWAPTGQYLLLVSREQRPDGSVRARLRGLPLANGEPRQLLSLPGEIVPSSYTWSPDGAQVAFLTRVGQLTSLGVVDVAAA